MKDTDNINRRNFLRNAGAAGLAGAGLIGASGITSTALAADDDVEQKEPFKFEPTEIHNTTIGDWTAEPYTDIRFMVPSGSEYWDHIEWLTGGRWSNPNDYHQAEWDHAVATFEDLANKSSYLGGVTLEMYTYPYDWFTNYDGNTNCDDLAPPGDCHESTYEPTINMLDNAMSSWSRDQWGPSGSAVYVWDVGDVHQGEMNDWEGSGSDEHHDMPMTDEALTRHNFWPGAANDTGMGADNLTADYAHVRVRIAPYMTGRLTSGGIHSLIRCRDDGYWNTTDTPPGSLIYPTDRDWELAAGVKTGETRFGGNEYTVTGAGHTTVTAFDDIFNSNSCRGDTPDAGEDWVGPEAFDEDGYASEVTYCTSDMVSQFIQYGFY